MRLHFQKRPWDLHAAVGYTLVVSAVLLALNVGNLLTILPLLFIPGYVLMSALFPTNTKIDWTERIALSFGLSVAILPLLGLLLNFTPFGIRFAPIIWTINLFTAGVGCTGYWRRMRTPLEQRLSLTVDIAVPDWRDYNALDKGLTIALAAGIVVVGGTLAYMILTPRQWETFTEFYILGPGGSSAGYPTNLTVNETGSVIVGVANHESVNVHYTIRIDLLGERPVYNATKGASETVEVNRTTLTWINATITNGANWTQPYTFSIPSVGLWKVQFLLYKNGDFSIPYRALHFFVKVT